MSSMKWLLVGACALSFAMAGCDDDDDTGAGDVGGAGGAPVGGEPVGGEPAGGAGGEPVGGMGGEPVGGAPMGGEGGMGGEPVGGEPVGGEPVGGMPVGGEPIGGGEPPMEAPVFGDFTDPFGGGHWVDDTVWLQIFNPTISQFDIEQLDVEGRFLVAQNNEANAFSPNLWSRFDWAEVDGTLYYCQTTFDAESQEAAAAVARADDADPANSGCGMFGWTAMMPGAMPFAGQFDDDFGTEHFISSTLWGQAGEGFDSTFFITQIDVDGQFAVGQNSPDNGFNPELWSRFDWAEINGEWYYCQSAFDAASAEDAAMVPRPDDSDPTTGGCGGMFPWSRLTASE